MRTKRHTGGSSGKAWRLVFRFLGPMTALLLLYAIVYSKPWAQQLVHDPASRLVAFLSWSVLSILGQTSLEQGTLLQWEGFTARVAPICNGVLPSYIYLSAILAFPSSWRAKLRGLAIGVPVLLALNLARVVSLMILGASRPDLFEQVHIYVWQALIIGVSMALWVFWAERFVRPGASSSP